MLNDKQTKAISGPTAQKDGAPAKGVKPAAPLAGSGFQKPPAPATNDKGAANG